LPYPDLTEALQARILADQKAEKVDQGPCNRGDPDEGGRVEALEARIATLEEAVAKAEALADQRCHEADTAAKRIEVLETHIATMKEVVAKAETLAEQRRREAETSAKRADDLVAEVIEMTSEFVEMSKRMAEQTAAMDKLRAEFCDSRSRS